VPPLVRLEYSEHFEKSLADVSCDNEQLVVRINRFIDWKECGVTPAPAFSADKPSGYRRNGRVGFRPFLDNGFRHCHLDIVGAEPLLVYRMLHDATMLRLVCIAMHAEMFDNKRLFFRKYRSEFPRTPRPR